MNIALIFAGGTGTRMNSHSKPKQFLSLHGKEIIIHTLEKFEETPEIDAILVVCLQEWIGHLEALVARNQLRKVRWIVPGGTTGQDSIYQGLARLEADAPKDSIVLIHDGVRPHIDSDLIRRNIDSVQRFGNAVTVAAATETIIAVDGERVDDILDRSRCYYAKAPQSFYLKDIIGAHRKARELGRDDFIDSASMIRHFGGTLHTVRGSYENLKITTPIDYFIFRAILESRENSQIFGI